MRTEQQERMRILQHRWQERLGRNWTHYWQRRVRGFDDAATWNLDVHLAGLIRVRLQRFLEVVDCHPCDMNFLEWRRRLQLMIDAFALVERGDDWTTEEEATYQEGMRYFARHFTDLWW